MFCWTHHLKDDREEKTIEKKWTRRLVFVSLFWVNDILQMLISKQNYFLVIMIIVCSSFLFTLFVQTFNFSIQIICRLVPIFFWRFLLVAHVLNSYQVEKTQLVNVYLSNRNYCFKPNKHSLIANNKDTNSWTYCYVFVVISFSLVLLFFTQLRTKLCVYSVVTIFWPCGQSYFEVEY